MQAPGSHAETAVHEDAASAQATSCIAAVRDNLDGASVVAERTDLTAYYPGLAAHQYPDQWAVCQQEDQVCVSHVTVPGKLGFYGEPTETSIGDVNRRRESTMKKRLAGVAAASLFAIGLASSPALASSPNSGCSANWNLFPAVTEADLAMDHNGDGFICAKGFKFNENANPKRGNSDFNNEVIKDNNSPA